jgi:hypothetical protein
MLAAACFAWLSAAASGHALVPVPGGDDPAGGGAPLPGGAGGAAGGGAGRTSGTGGGGGSGPSPMTGSCDGFMLCTPPHTGHGSMVGFTISLAPEIADQTLDQIVITLKIAGEEVSWSPQHLPDVGTSLVLPLTTPMFQSCANTYGDAVATVSGLRDGKVVASAAGTFVAQDCVAFAIPVELQPVGTAGTGVPSAGHSASGMAGGGAGSSAGGSHASDGGAVHDTTPGGDESGCNCVAVGVPRSRLAWISSVLGSLLALIRLRRRRRAPAALEVLSS